MLAGTQGEERSERGWSMEKAASQGLQGHPKDQHQQQSLLPAPPDRHPGLWQENPGFVPKKEP